MSVERRAYIENMAAQEAAYWYCREHGIRADDFDIGQILQVAAPIILQGAVAALREIATRPVVERNPDGDDQAAHTMQMIAREALDALGEQGTWTTTS